jgi:hypothetical protein
MRFHPIFSYTYAYMLALAEFELQDHTYSTLNRQNFCTSYSQKWRLT